MRLLARVYADGPTPSKVSKHDLMYIILTWRSFIIVVAQFHEKKVHGQILMIEDVYR